MFFNIFAKKLYLHTPKNILWGGGGEKLSIPSGRRLYSSILQVYTLFSMRLHERG